MTQSFNHHLLKLIERGVTQRLSRKYKIEMSSHVGFDSPGDSKDNPHEELSYEHLVLLFGILPAGMVLAVGIFMAELCLGEPTRASPKDEYEMCPKCKVAMERILMEHGIDASSPPSREEILE